MTDKKTDTKTNEAEDGKTQPLSSGAADGTASATSTDVRLSASGKPGIEPGAGGAGTDPSAPTPMVGAANPAAAKDRVEGK